MIDLFFPSSFLTLRILLLLPFPFKIPRPFSFPFSPLLSPLTISFLPLLCMVPLLFHSHSFPSLSPSFCHLSSLPWHNAPFLLHSPFLPFLFDRPERLPRHVRPIPRRLVGFCFDWTYSDDGRFIVPKQFSSREVPSLVPLNLLLCHGSEELETPLIIPSLYAQCMWSLFPVDCC